GMTRDPRGSASMLRSRRAPGRVGLAILAREAGPARDVQVYIRIVAIILVGPARPHLEQESVPVGTILQVVPVRDSGLEAGAVAGVQSLLTAVRYQHDLALQNIHELILGAVPVPLTRPGTRWQPQVVHAEIRELGGIAEPAPLTRRTGRIERR